MHGPMNIKFTLSPLFLDFLTLEDGTDRLSRNVGKELPPYAAQYARTAQNSSTSRPESEVTQVSCCILYNSNVQHVSAKVHEI
jgi:hypothetical protein